MHDDDRPRNLLIYESRSPVLEGQGVKTLHVHITLEDPRVRLERLRRRALKDDSTIELILCDDLMRSVPPNADQDVRALKQKVVAELRRAGHMVNGIRNVFRAYVIELDATKAPSKCQGGRWVYVGQTILSPEERFDRHKAGSRNRRGPLFSRVVQRHGIRLLPELYEHLAPVFDRDDARELERVLAESLRARGYCVEGGH